MDAGKWILIISTEIAFVIGLMTHVFLLNVIIVDWRKKRTISTSDQVILSIVISKLLLQCVIQIDILLNFLDEISPLFIDMINDIVLLSTILTSIWLSTLLSVTLYFKIVTLHNVIFLWIKKNIVENNFFLIIAVILVSTGLPSISISIGYFLKSGNSTQGCVFGDCSLDVAFGVLELVLNIFPFLTCFLSSLLLITSLALHIRRMRCTQHSTSSLKVYFKAIKFTVVSFLTCVLYIILNIADVYTKGLESRFYYFLAMICAILHSMYITYARTTVKKSFSMVLLRLSSCLFRREKPNSSEPDEH
ncbi:hypothetical protein GDO81_025884 [Engystomops pustulosus]|uniref:Taste receptor type 2 n=1 Tax=Engystomops pustulosus TaxID=76066 RepID=A0AAV6ZLP8_ENGPU|nr:hypothetical protein GDO81_025884 [Engystomops pustulosus]